MSFLSRKILQANSAFRYLRNDIRHSAGLVHNLFKNKEGGSRIVCYHGICLHEPLRFNASFITQKTLEAHLQFYKKHFNVVTLDQYFAGELSTTRFNIALTFDDGHYNNLKYALPLLELYQLPATFFITGIRSMGYDILWNDFLAVFSKYGSTKLVYKGQAFFKNRRNHYISHETGQSLQQQITHGGFELKAEMIDLLEKSGSFRHRKSDEDYWLQMTTEDIQQLSRSKYARIGAHGLYHNDLTRIMPQATREEFFASKSFLENNIQKRVHSFAFPYGRYDSIVKTAAKDAGFDQLLALEFLIPESDRTDNHIRERMVVNPYISVHNQMLAIINGKY